MSEMEVDSVIETIDNTSRYRLQLTELMESLNQAEEQVKHTAEETRQQLKVYMSDLRTHLCQALDDREVELLHEIDTAENTALNPLVMCQDVINSGMSQASAVMAEGKGLLMSDHEANKDRIIDFTKRINDLNLNSLPEVPSLADVASLSIQFPPSAIEDILQQISEHGKISSHSLVKIVDISQRPGALLVMWAEVEHDEENVPDISEFKLQYTSEDSTATDAPSYETIYQGPSMSYLVRHIKQNQPYTFRLCCRGDEDSEWSTWCVPRVAMTTLKHHEWCSSVIGYSLSNDNRTAAVDSSSDSCLPVLHSATPSYLCGHGLEFSIIDIAEGEVFDNGGIGISFDKSEGESLMRPGALFVNSLGQVYVDGKKLTNVLPSLTQGSTLTFNTELISPNKIRVSIETNDKQVTVDWKEDREPTHVSAQGNGDWCIPLYFGLQFQSIGWKVFVQ